MIKITKYIVPIVLLLLLVKTGKAQQDPMYTQYMHNQLTINPAYAGSSGMLSAMLLARKQWVGFDNAPESRVVSVNMPLSGYRFGVGASYINDVLGPVKQNSFYADFTYHLPINENAKLGMGLKAGFDMMQIDLNGMKTIDERPDPSFKNDYEDNFIPNFGIGLYYYTPRFYVGLSVPRLLENKYDDDDTEKTTSLGYREKHYFLTAGALFDLGYRLKLKPTMLAKVVKDAPASIDVSASLIINDIFWVGAGYRINDSFNFLLHYQLTQQLRVGYAFDLSNSDIRHYNNGTHEIMVAFDFRFKKKRMLTPRYF